MTDVAEQVRAWRAHEGLSLERAGAMLGVAHTTVRDWEAGRTPGGLNLAKLDSVLGTPGHGAPTLREARVRRGLTLQQFARRLSVAVSTASSWEHGHRRPSCAHRAGIVRLLRLGPADAERLLPACCDPTTCRVQHNDAAEHQLARLRRTRGLARGDAAARLGISASRLARYESGVAVPDLALCAAMARLYRTPFEVVARAGRFEPHPLLDRRRWVHASLGEVLVVLRRACGLSRARVARELRVTARTVHRWETGLSVPTERALHGLEGRFGLAIGELQPLAARTSAT